MAVRADFPGGGCRDESRTVPCSSSAEHTNGPNGVGPSGPPRLACALANEALEKVVQRRSSTVQGHPAHPAPATPTRPRHRIPHRHSIGGTLRELLVGGE